MRLPADDRAARPAGPGVALFFALVLAAYAPIAVARPAPPALAPTNGPQADFPLVVGAPYTIDGIEFVPEDVLNYDRVGVVAADEAGGGAVSGAHHTLPLPSYVEVTSLDTGRTALVRLERRGPMTGHELVALSPGALAQLEIAPGAPVRVRRVNPPEEQRALLRAGQPAPLRMDTPMALVEVLRRKLPGAAPAAAPAQVAEASAPVTLPVVAAPAQPDMPTPPPLDRPADLAAAPAAVPAVAVPAPTRARSADGKFVVQAAAFSTADRATRVADELGGEVSRSGPYFRVRTGPFTTRGEAEASLAKVRAAGYRDARIFTSG